MSIGVITFNTMKQFVIKDVNCVTFHHYLLIHYSQVHYNHKISQGFVKKVSKDLTRLCYIQNYTLSVFGLTFFTVVD